MNFENFQIDLEKHVTKDIKDGHVNGSLSVIWRDWDEILHEHPKMVYVSSVNPGEIKGPHIHQKRDSYFSCIHGKVTFVIKTEDGYVEIESDSDHPNLIYVPKNVASAHINNSKNVSRILVLANVSWKPNDNEMVDTIFDDYNWNKLKMKTN
tara:strand:+ start:1652 stop:2107 length:456 start_codon:yes stop_codon:yes gene_type:complete